MNRREFLAAASVSALEAARVPGANDRIAVAIIGCGDRGLLREVLDFHRETNVEVAAVCDTWRPQREKAIEAVRKAAGNTPQEYVHYQDTLANPKIDAVVISTPDHQHCTMLRDAVRAGKDVYIEKPLAMDMRELLEAVDAVKKSDRVVQVGTQVRSFPPSMAAREFVASGGLGKIFKIEQSRNSYRPYWHRMGERSIREEDVDWKAFLMNVRNRPFDADQYTAWYGYREFSRGPQTNLAVHFIDLVHYITGSKLPRSVMSMAGTYRWKDKRTVPDSVEILLEYPEDGFLVRYNTTFGTSGNNFLKFFGTRGTMDATRWNEPWLLSGEPGEADRIPAGTKIPPVDSTPHMKNWLECLRTRKTPAAPIEAGYAHAVASLMADESLTRGVRMVYDPGKRRIYAG